MKLIPLIIWVISFVMSSESHESYTYPSEHNSGVFSSEKQFYLPSDSYTAMQYVPVKNFERLPFPYLPPTVTKMAPSSPSGFSITPSTTILPTKADDDNNEENDDKFSTSFPQYTRNQYNRTQIKPIQTAERREMRFISNKFQQPIDRIDTKLPFHFNNNLEVTTQNSGMQSMSPRSIMISDIQREHNNDHVKASSYQGSQYLSQSGIYMSTTETAIPILRLSNEMDLDGSFSYEALGADQTHYVQHSRMENTGADKEEQVVEGSYSYVGDNGKTYTVNYIADSNGFRASGDHLPVPPPIPEIIQRAIQYNLAEELKKPPHLKSWQDEEKEQELNESEKRNHFAVSPPHLSNLFTGKTPESFSHSFSQASNTQNNLVAAASSQTPIQIVDFKSQLQNKPNSGTISPQITFVASQGAHIPSVKVPQQEQNIGRVFTTERTSLPQIVNYEANIKDTDRDSDKTLWRWQYGINANLNQNMDKNLISRSFSEDDISINFSDMTADQYSKMIKQQLEPNVGQIKVISPNIPEFKNSNNQDEYKNLQNYSNTGNGDHININNNFNTVNPTTSESYYSTTKPAYNSTDWYKNFNDYHSSDVNTKESQNEVIQTSRPKLITQDHFIPRSQTVTQSYNYDENDLESRKTRTYKSASERNLNVIPLNYEISMQGIIPETTKHENQQIISTTQKSPPWTTKSNFKFSDFVMSEEKNNFKPIFTIPETSPKETTTTTELNMETLLEENIFLKNMFRNNKNDQENNNRIKDESKYLQVKPIIETRTHNYPSPKFIQTHEPYYEPKTISKKPVNIADLMNYLYGNQFESNKIRSKPKHSQNNFKQQNEMQYFLINDDQETVENRDTKNFRTLQQQEELRGTIKNYKVLQRNNNVAYTERDNIDRLSRNMNPPSAKTINLPPLGRAGPTTKSYIPPIYA